MINQHHFAISAKALLNFLLFYTTALIFIAIGCNGGNNNITYDPTDIYIYRTQQGILYAKIAHNGVLYEESEWPESFTDPTFTWQEKDPRSTANYCVGYGVNRSDTTAVNLWEYTPNDSEGCYYYHVQAYFYDSLDVYCWGESNTGVNLYKIINYGGYDSDHCNSASGYIRVPYVYRIVPDSNGDNCGKTIDNGYRGNDCSGLAWHSGYHGDETVGYTDCSDLAEDYGQELPVDSLEQIINQTYIEYLDGCMVLIDYDADTVADHVGIILNQDYIYCGEVIHATAASQIEIRYEHGRMAMREDLADRSYWIDDYYDIGREDADK